MKKYQFNQFICRINIEKKIGIKHYRGNRRIHKERYEWRFICWRTVARTETDLERYEWRFICWRTVARTETDLERCYIRDTICKMKNDSMKHEAEQEKIEIEQGKKFCKKKQPRSMNNGVLRYNVSYLTLDMMMPAILILTLGPLSSL